MRNMTKRRRYLLSSEKVPRVPEEYQEVAWLRGTGSQWCSLPYRLGFSDGHFYGLKGDITQVSSDTYSQFCVSSEVGIASQAQYRMWGARLYAGMNVGESPIVFPKYRDPNDYHFEINRNSIVINDSVTNNPNYTQELGQTIELGARQNTSGARIIENSNVEIKSIIITYDDQKLAEFIPCYRVSDNKAGFFYWIDYAQGTSGFITNSASGSDFLVGPNV